MKRAFTVFLIAFLVVSLIVSIPFFTQILPAHATGWLTGWTYSQSFTVAQKSGAGAGYAINLTIYATSGTSSGNILYLNSHAKADFSDLRFTASDGSTLLQYWMQMSNSTTAIFWVKLTDNLSSGSSTVYVYYGDSGASSVANGEQTFPFFDDFPGASLNTSKWTVRGGSPTVSNSVLYLATGAMINSTSTFGYNTTFATCALVNASDTGNNGYGLLGYSDTIIVAGATSNSNYFVCDYASPYYRGRDITAGTGTLVTMAESRVLEYKIYDVTLNSGRATFQMLQNSSYSPTGAVKVITTNVPSISMAAELIARATYASEVWSDWVYVRNYVSPEPTLGSWTAEAQSAPTTSATIVDFYINNTATAASTGFTFNVSDTVSLANATFMYNNGTGWYTQTNTTLSGTNENVTFTVPPVSSSTTITFNCTVFNTNTTLSGGTTGTRTLSIYSTSMPYTSLGKAITAVEGANSWTTANTTTGLAGVDPYQGLILNQNTTAQYESVIDNMAYGSTVVNPANHVYCTTYFTATGWSTPVTKAFDNDTSTGTSYTMAASSSSTYIGFNLSAVVNGTSIEYAVDTTDPTFVQMYVSISNDSSSWTQVFSGYPTYGAVATNFTFTRSLFSYMEYSFYNSRGSGNSIAFVNETRSWTDSYSHVVNDYLGVLQYCAYSEKMNITWTNKQRDILWALGNITMLGSLPTTTSYVGTSAFGVSSTWALYGYYYANNSWASAYQSKWNITPAYTQFNASVYQTVSGPSNGMPLWIWSNNTGLTYTNRYYDEDAECIQDYLVFDFLLNQSDGLTQAAYWWNYLVNNHWNPLDSLSDNKSLQYFRYSQAWNGTQAYEFECEAGFFLKITSILKYYVPTMSNYGYVLTDIGLRFLSGEWNSYQWLTTGTTATTYVVTHLYGGNDKGNSETRLQNTLAAWQALLGAFVQFNSTYQSNMVDMLAGNTTSNVQPAWSLLMSSTPGLYDSGTKAFKIANDGSETAFASAMGEITLFQMGIVPGTSTVAFPLEELSYEYVDDIDPVLMAFNLNQTARQVTIPVVQAGTITFQYGESPITYTFSASGVYLITFTNSWNMIASISGPTTLPKNVIYFYAPPPIYSNIGTNSTVWATQCRFSVLFIANYGNLSGFVFGSNNTGIFVNQTWTGTWSNWPTTTSAWANYTVAALNSTNSNATRPEIIQYRWWANNTSNSWTDTGLQTLTLCWPLSTGWNNVTIFSFDVGFTLGGLNASLNYDSINWTYIIYQNSSSTAQYVFVKGYTYNNLVKVYQTSGILLIFCGSAGSWTHTYPLQGGNYGSDPTPAIITTVTLAIVLGIYLVWRRKKKPAT